MKQTLAMLFVTALLLFSLAGCGEKKDSNTANGPSTGTTDNGAADSNKKDDNASGDDMSPNGRLPKRITSFPFLFLFRKRENGRHPSAVHLCDKAAGGRFSQAAVCTANSVRHRQLRRQ